MTPSWQSTSELLGNMTCSLWKYSSASSYLPIRL